MADADLEEVAPCPCKDAQMLQRTDMGRSEKHASHSSSSKAGKAEAAPVVKKSNDSTLPSPNPS